MKIGDFVVTVEFIAHADDEDGDGYSG